MVVTAIVDGPLPVTEDGVKVTVEFGGAPLALRETGPVKPFSAVMVTV